MYIIGRWMEDELYHLFGYSDGVYDIAVNNVRRVLNVEF